MIERGQAVFVEYRLDGGAWTTYSAPVAVSAAGEHTVEYRATDVAGNVSAVRSVSFKVDAAAPALIDGLAFLNGRVYLQRSSQDQIQVFDPATDTDPVWQP